MVSALAWVTAGLALKWICSPTNVNRIKMNKNIRDQIVMELLNSVQRETQSTTVASTFNQSINQRKLLMISKFAEQLYLASHLATSPEMWPYLAASASLTDLNQMN